MSETEVDVTKEACAASEIAATQHRPSWALAIPSQAQLSPQYLHKEPHPIGYFCPSTLFHKAIRLSGLGLESGIIVVNQREQQSWGSFEWGTRVLSGRTKMKSKISFHSWAQQAVAIWVDHGQSPLNKNGLCLRNSCEGSGLGKGPFLKSEAGF